MNETIEPGSIKKGMRKQKRRIFIYIGFAVATFFIASVLGIYTAINFGKLSLMDMLITLMPQSGLDNNVNILVAGVDNTDGVKRTDTIMLINVDSNRNRIGVLSIPRDTRAEVPGHGFTKINHAYAYGGIDLSVRAVTNFLHVPVNYYVEIKLSGVVNVIDELGGITIDVPKRMYYVDRSGDLYINLQPGRQVLSGKQAMGYVRYRHDAMGDIGRIQRQQDFMKAVADKIIESGNLFRAPQLFKQLTSNFNTNLSTKQLLIFALKMRAAYAENHLYVDTIPGYPAMIGGLSYWVPDMQGTVHVVDKIIHGIDASEQGSAASDKTSSPAVTVTQPAKTSLVEPQPVARPQVQTAPQPKAEAKAAVVEKKPEPKALGPGVTLSARTINQLMPSLKPVEKGSILPKDMKLSIEVLNGSGYPYTAQKIARHLKEKGIKVPWVGNAGHFNYEKTIIVDWKGMTQEVLQLANSLGVDPKNIITYNKPNKKLDVTIVVGRDWKKINSRL